MTTVDSFVNQKQLLNLDASECDLRRVKFILGINATQKRLSFMKSHLTNISIIFYFGDRKSGSAGGRMKTKMNSKVAKTFNIKQETLMLLKKLQEVQNVNLSAFADKILRKGAEEALGMYLGENIGEKN